MWIERIMQKPFPENLRGCVTGLLGFEPRTLNPKTRLCTATSFPWFVPPATSAICALQGWYLCISAAHLQPCLPGRIREPHWTYLVLCTIQGYERLLG